MPAIPWGAINVGMAASSAILGFMGGQKQDRYAQRMVEKQHEADIASWEFNFEEAEDAYKYALEDISIAEWNFQQTKKHRDAQALRDWIDKDTMRMFDYNQQVKAYNASVESYGVQLEFNDIAADLTTAAAQRAQQDKLTLMGYQFEDIQIAKTKAERDIGVKRRLNVQDLKSGKRSLASSKDKLKAGAKARTAEMNAKLEQQRIQGFVQEGKVLAQGRAGSSAVRAAFAARQASRRLEDAIMDAMGRAEQTTGLDLVSINQKLEALGDKIDLQDETLINELWDTRINVEYNEAQLKDQLKSQNLAFEAAEQKRKLDKYGEDLRAREAIAPEPVLAPKISKPLELPEPQLQKPRKPRKGPRPIKGAAVTGHGLAGLASGVQGITAAIAGLG